MKKMFVFAMVIGFIQMKAETTQQIKSMNQVFEAIGQSTDDIFTFAKLTMEESYALSEKKEDLLTLQRTGHVSFEWLFDCTDYNNEEEEENVGKYLNGVTDDELRKKITKNYIAEGRILLNDFFNTSVYKGLQNELKGIVQGMTSCSFISSEESKKIRKFNGFYPNDYKTDSYSWTPIFKHDKMLALEGRLHKVIGLKGCNNHISENCFIMDINIVYRCNLGKTEERDMTFRHYGMNDTCSKYKVDIAPQHSMDIDVTFLNQTKTGKCTAVWFFYDALCEENATFHGNLEKNKHSVSEKKFDPSSSWITSDQIDVETAQQPLLIAGRCIISSGTNIYHFQEMISQCSDFIVNVPNKDV